MRIESVRQRATSVFRVVRPEEVEWKPFAALPRGARLAVLVGDPTQAGPYVIRVHLRAGTKMMPHQHAEDRVYVVLAGVFYIGLGDEFDPDRLVAYGVGSVLVLPGGQSHFHWAKSGDYVTQVTAFGPLALDYVNPADDPRRRAPLHTPVKRSPAKAKAAARSEPRRRRRRT